MPSLPVAIDRPNYAALYLVAEGQRGYFTTCQARVVGISNRLLPHWVKAGHFHRVVHGIYRLRDFPATPREELAVPLLWAGPGRALSYETALEIYGLGDVLPSTTHLTVLPSFRPRSHPGLTLHHDALATDDVARRDDLRLTTVERTIVDCFHWGTDRDQLILAARQAIDQGLTDSRRLQATVGDAGIARAFESARFSKASE